MPKKIKVKYDEKLGFVNLYNAFYRARKGKINKKEIIKFEQNLESNLISIYDELFNLTYTRQNIENLPFTSQKKE